MTYPQGQKVCFTEPVFGAAGTHDAAVLEQGTVGRYCRKLSEVWHQIEVVQSSPSGTRAFYVEAREEQFKVVEGSEDE